MNAATRLAIVRLRDADDGRLSFFSSRQIDARQLVFALRRVLAAERLEQVALAAFGIDAAVGDALTAARRASRTRFLA
jgi:alpha-D-ribose 1-methylphosphonate 5-triphosphate synthase subunit PhnI